MYECDVALTDSQKSDSVILRDVPLASFEIRLVVLFYMLGGDRHKAVKLGSFVKGWCCDMRDPGVALFFEAGTWIWIWISFGLLNPTTA